MANKKLMAYDYKIRLSLSLHNRCNEQFALKASTDFGGFCRNNNFMGNDTTYSNIYYSKTFQVQWC